MLKRIVVLTVSSALIIILSLYLPNRPPVIVPAISSNNIGNVQIYFPRQGQDPADVLPALYLSATDNIDVAAYSLTHPAIVKAIGDARKIGIKVRVITDKAQVESNTQKHAINDLLLIGIPVKENLHSGLMHLKMSIIDGEIATTGSYNYSKAASNTNDEIFIVVQDKWFANRCETEFNRMWDSSEFQALQINY